MEMTVFLMSISLLVAMTHGQFPDIRTDNAITHGQSSDIRTDTKLKTLQKRPCSCVPASRKAKICASRFSIAGRVLASQREQDNIMYLVEVLKNYGFKEERLKQLMWISTPRFDHQCGFPMKRDTVYFLNGYFKKDGQAEINRCGYNELFFDVPHSLRRQMRYPDYCDNYSWKKNIQSEDTARSPVTSKDIRTEILSRRRRIIFA